MDNRGRGHRDSGHGNNHLLSASDQQAFMEAISVAIATNAQASAMVSQGGSSNLQRFKAYHPHTFRGGRDPMIADHWF